MGYPAARKCNPSNKALKQSGWKLAPLPADAAGANVGPIHDSFSLMSPTDFPTRRPIPTLLFDRGDSDHAVRIVLCTVC
jgi:hypothetical protein